MKGKSFVQQPFGKIQASKHLTIKINQAPQSPLNRAPFSYNYDLPNSIKEQINQIKTRIQNSEKILQESRRQEGHNIKIVNSDYIPLNFNYNSAKTYKPNLNLDQLDQKQSEDSLQNEQSEGPIQLPVHLQPSTDERNYLSARNTQKKSYFKSNLLKELGPLQKKSWKTDRVLCLNQLTNSLEKLNINQFTKQVQTPKSSQRVGFYRDQYLRQKQLSKSKQKFSIDNNWMKKENVQSSKSKNLIKQSSKSKQQTDQLTNVQKIKIKLNRPNPGKIDTKDHYSTRPRYHIKMPSVKTYYQDSSVQNQNSTNPILALKNGWEQLKQKLKKYEFVRKYLNQSDLHEIYEHLRKNHINQEKWPLFVVDQAYKKMNTHKYP